MSRARIFAVENQLARIAREPGGRTIETALKAAETRIEAARETSVAALAEKAEQLAQRAVAGRRGEDPEAFARIYDISNAIYGLAAAFGLKALAEAAFSLCDLADSYRSGETPNWPAIDVHVDGVRLLASMGDKAGEAGATAILEGLRRVRARVLPDENP
jgi:hypothetical protein